MLCGRFCVITNDLYAKPLAQAAEKMHRLAQKLLWWKPADWQRRPQRLAAGLLGISLAGESLLHLEDLRLQHIHTQAWGQLFLDSQMIAVLPRCRLSPRYTQHVLTSLVGAANLPLEEIKQDCEFTMRCLQGAAGALRRTGGLAFSF